VVQSKPGQLTDVLVRGRPNPLQVAGTVGGTKIMEIRRLAALGHAVTVIGDKQFWRLVDGAKKTPTKTRGPQSARSPRRKAKAR